MVDYETQFSNPKNFRHATFYLVSVLFTTVIKTKYIFNLRYIIKDITSYMKRVHINLSLFKP